MIKFFRNIRLRLLTQAPTDTVRQDMQTDPPEGRSRAGKYLMYALGEIVLVVAGILIALSINNQNEDRKSQALVSIYKTQLVTDLEGDLNHFEYHLSLAKEENKRIDSLRAILQNSNADLNTLNDLIKDGISFIRKEPYIMLASTEYSMVNYNTISSLQNSGQITLLDNKMQEELVSFYGYTKKYVFMMDEIIANKNELYFDFIKSIPAMQSDLNIVNNDVYARVWNHVDWSRVQIKYISLVNAYYELNLKTQFFNDMRLYKTKIMIEKLQSGFKN